MPTIANRFAGILSGAAARVESIARSIRGPEVSRVATIPGIAHYGEKRPDDQTRRALESFGLYASRVAPLAGPTRTRWALWPGDNLTPEIIVAAQRDAVTSGIPLRWVELIDQIYSRDGHYAAVTAQRVEDCIKGTWRLTRAAPDDAGTAMRNFAAEAYNQCSRWRDGLGWLLFSNLYSYNAVEVEWEIVRNFTFPGPKGETIGPIEVALPRRLHNVHPKHFRFDLESDDPLFWIGNSYQPLPIGKFIFLDGEGLHPIKVRRGHAWQCIWYSLFRSIGWSAWAVHVDRFSLPTPLIEYDGDIASYTEYEAAYRDILNNLGQGKGAVLPKTGATFRTVDPPAGGRSNDPASALSDACDSGQSIRVMGATLTTKIGNVGSFSASTTHAEVKYAKEENDVGRLWERIDEQLTHPMILFNAVAIAEALTRAGYAVTPDLLTRRIPKGKHRVPRESDPYVEMQIADIAVNKLSLPLSEEGMLDRIDFPRATSKEDRIKGEPQQVPAGASLIAGAQAAEAGAEGAKNPDTAGEAQAEAAQAKAKQDAGKGPGGDGGSSPKARPPRAELAAPVPRLIFSAGVHVPARELPSLAEALQVLEELGPLVDADQAALAFAHGDQPRDANGRFAAVAGAKATVAAHVAKHLTENGHAAEVRGSTVHLKNGGTIEIGNKGERTYTNAGPKAQKAVEAHLNTHPEKQVRAWTQKTTPAPPPPRKVDPVKAAAREKAKQERQATRAAARAEKQKAREGKRAERETLKGERQKAVAERHQARKQKRGEQVAALKAIGAPVTPDGKIDARKVPGADKHFQPLTSADPANSYKGRSFYARSAKEMASEFIGAVSKDGNNEGLLLKQVGTGYGTMRDKAQWDAINEKYESKAETFDEAFQVLASASAKASGGRRPDWRHLDLGALQECAGLQDLQLPTWLHEAQGHEEEKAQMAAYYDRAGHEEPEGQGDGEANDAGATYHPPGKDEDVPF